MYYFWGMHWFWWFFWILLWVMFFSFMMPMTPDYLPGIAIASAVAAKEICRRGDHKRGIRRAA